MKKFEIRNFCCCFAFYLPPRQEFDVLKNVMPAKWGKQCVFDSFNQKCKCDNRL